MHIVKPKRVCREYTQHLVAPVAAVFPLLCPVREAEWIEGWDPRLVLSHSGVAEPDCVFVTEAGPCDGIWYITRHEADAGVVEMIKITPGVTACRLNIAVEAVEGGSAATIRYMYTSLSAEGDKFVEAFTETYFTRFMQDWEARMNYYLVHGIALGEVRCA